jgi:hypothetical protein
MANIRLGRIDQSTKDHFENLCVEAGFDGRGKDQAFLQALLTRWESAVTSTNESVDSATATIEATGSLIPAVVLPALHLSDDEYKEILEALACSHGSFEEFIRVSLLSEARRNKDQAARVEGRALAEPDQRARVRGAGYVYVESVVRQLMADNLQASNPMERVYITRGQVADMTGTNRADINRFFDNHREMLEQHHKQVGFDTPEHGISHNRHRAQYLKRKNASEPEN